MNLKFSLIVCTYMRSEAIQNLLGSVAVQTLYPNEILIVDGSIDNKTEAIFEAHPYKNLSYYKVKENDRGLTKQRNFGVAKTSQSSEIICFLDDDIILEPDYFEQLISTYKKHPKALAVGGYITNEVKWQVADNLKNKNNFYFDGWMRTEPSRFKMRRKFGLLPDVSPGFMPSFSHGRSVSFLPPSNKIYEVEQIMGGVSSYKKTVFQKLSFSTFFEGYGLYEDADFSLRLAKQGKLYINTKARLEHHHDGSGRPNKYQYGKMVVQNGWYVWRVKNENPSIRNRLKWYGTSVLLMIIRGTNVITSSNKKEAFTEVLGRFIGVLRCVFKLNRK